MEDLRSDYEFELYVAQPGPRPPFAEVVDHVYGADANVDTEGDSSPADSTEWTWLYMQLRTVRDSPVVEIVMLDEDHTLMRVGSDDEALAAKTAEFLAIRTGGRLEANPNAIDPPQPSD